MKESTVMLTTALAAALLSGCSTTEPVQPEETIEQPVAVEAPEAVETAEEVPAAEIQPAEAGPAAKPGELGSSATPLDSLIMIKGDPVTFEAGKVYVVEFWATWCPPCRTSIPHLTEVQAKFKNQGVTVIGITSEKDPEKVSTFVAEQGEHMDYTVAMDTEGTVSAGYMAAFNQQGIPVAFIVDGKGTVAWVGHPVVDMEAVLEKVVAGTFDPDVYAKEKAERDAAEKKLFQQLKDYVAAVQGGATIEESRPLAEAFLAANPPPTALNALGWQIMKMPDVEEDHRDLEIALKSITLANTETNGENPYILNTYAMALARQGKLEEAIEVNKQALEAAVGDERLKADLQQHIDLLKEQLKEEAATP